jgi:hypothetical protein
MLQLEDGHVNSCDRWRRTAALLLELADADRVRWRVQLALFYDARLDMRAME